jgi:uncharacterized protein with FMN-binding domain
LQSSSPYTFRPVKTKKTGNKTTFFLSAAAIAAGVVWGINPNGGFGAIFPKATQQTTSLTSTNSNTSNSSSPATAQGDPIDYQFGTVQVSVTRSNGKITAIDYVQDTATAGREQAFSMLTEAAISANGSNFGNISGATYTTDAFKQALDSAIAKLP